MILRSSPMSRLIGSCAFIGAIFAVVSTHRALAQERKLDEPPKFGKLRSVPGEPVSIAWPDGRIAVLKVHTQDSKALQATFQVTENSCTAKIGMTCSYHFTARLVRVGLFWSAHPDSAKIGTLANRQYSPTSGLNPISRDATVTGLTQAQAPTYQQGLPAHEIRCQDFSWLPPGNRQAPQTARILRWESEFNIENPETDAPENRVVGGLYGVNLQRTGEGRMRLAGYQHATTSSFLTGLGTIIGTNIDLVLRTTDNKPCQVGLSSNAQGELQGEITALMDQPTPPTGGRALTPEDVFKIDDDEILETSLAEDLDNWSRAPQEEVK